jgi:hypothetical protein
MLLAIPSFFDLVATVLMNIGLLSVTASVYQMMRGAEMLFAALFAVLFLKRHLNRFHYMGIGCCAVSAAAAETLTIPNRCTIMTVVPAGSITSRDAFHIVSAHWPRPRQPGAMALRRNSTKQPN